MPWFPAPQTRRIRSLTLRSLAAVAVAIAGSLCAAPAARAALERLPADVRALSQTIALEIDPSRASYSGSVRIELTVAKSRPDLLFHSQKIDLGTMTLRGAGGATGLRAANEDEEGLVRAVRSDGGTIEPGRYTLEIAFTNEFDERASSLYRLKVKEEWYAFTQFEACDARAAFPCFDEPSVKIPYQFTLTIPAGEEAVTNSPIVSDRTSDGRRTIVFLKTKPLPSYLLAIAVGPLEFTPVKGTSIPTRIVTVKGKSRLTGPVAAMVPPILGALETYFGRRYPFEKLDLLAVPEYVYGAMENPGAVTYSDQFLLFDPKSMSVSQRRTLARFTSHELSHMWFGDLVTMEWWDDLWLNESFAEWMGDKIVTEVYPELDTRVSGLGETEAAYTEDSRLTARTIRQPVTTAANLLSTVDALTYQKGQSVLEMMESWLGPATFRRGVLAYLKEHEWGNAVEADLWRALSKASGRDVGAMGSTYFNQPGIPIVRGELLEDGRIVLRQARFLNYGLQDSVARLWQIPLSIRYPTPKGLARHQILLTGRDTTAALPGLAAPPPWIQLNADQAGYYRWRVEGTAMTRLASEAVSVLTPRERFGFLLNAYALLKGGAMRGDEYAKLLAGFADDPDPSVVSAVSDGVGAVGSYFVTEDLRDPFAEYVRRVLGGALTRIGLEAKAGESPSVSSLRPELFAVLADEGKDAKLRAYARAQTDRYLAGENVDPSMQGPALRIAALEGDSALFGAFLKRFEGDPVPSERGRLLGAIGSFEAPELRARAFDYVLSGPLKPQELNYLLGALAKRPEHEDETWTWVAAHYDRIVKRIPALYVIYLPWFASGCDLTRLEAARAFFAEPAHLPPGTEAELLKMAASVTECAGLREREGGALRSYLRAGVTAP
ncbi:MAG TPA: M1 family aminopeptidase [Candidatus Eisenbacteria bacterium]|nr:M1 family aminopeptidase [Candidatus Eisenbacteria bacterium]